MYKTTFARVTQSHANLAVNSVFITFRSMRETKKFHFFHFSKLFFIQNYRFIYHGDHKISWWRIYRWRAVNFEIHLCCSGVISDCIWRSTSIQYVQIEPGVNFDLRNGSFWLEIGDAEHVDLYYSWKCTRVWSYQLTSDLKDVYFFFNMLAMVVSESSFSAYFCLQ